MVTETQLAEYLTEIREKVCSRCIDRPPGGPPCGPRGKQCGIELHLSEIVDLAHAVHSVGMEPYTDGFHADVCSHCAARPTHNCPCPLDFLLLLAIEAVEAVDQRQIAESESASPTVSVGGDTLAYDKQFGSERIPK